MKLTFAVLATLMTAAAPAATVVTAAYAIGAAGGHYADIVAVAGDPGRDVRLLEHLVRVLKGGHAVVSPGR